MIYLLLAACRPDVSPGSGTYNPPVRPGVVVLQDVDAVHPIEGDFSYGTHAAVGSDLDKDGVLEWSTSAPRDYESWSASVYTYERREVISIRDAGLPGNSVCVEAFSDHLAGGGDTDGDGYAELAFTEMNLCEGGQVRVARTTDPNDDIHLLVAEPPPGFGYRPNDVTFVRVGSVDLVLMASSTGPYLRWDLFELQDVGPGEELRAGDHTLVYQATEDQFGFPGNAAAVDINADGMEEWFAGLKPLGVGSAWACPTETGASVPQDCLLMNSEGDEGIGAFQAAGDLTGDGVPELVSAAATAAGADGEISIFTTEGTRLAHIQGTRGAMFGRRVSVMTDDDGVGWLLTSDARAASPDVNATYAYRGDQLVGELLDTDALYTFTTNTTGNVGDTAIAYRATKDDPLQLLLTQPGSGDGRVFLVDW